MASAYHALQLGWVGAWHNAMQGMHDAPESFALTAVRVSALVQQQHITSHTRQPGLQPNTTDHVNESCMYTIPISSNDRPIGYTKQKSRATAAAPRPQTYCGHAPSKHRSSSLSVLPCSFSALLLIFSPDDTGHLITIEVHHRVLHRDLLGAERCGSSRKPSGLGVGHGSCRRRRTKCSSRHPHHGPCCSRARHGLPLPSEECGQREGCKVKNTAVYLLCRCPVFGALHSNENAKCCKIT